MKVNPFILSQVGEKQNELIMSGDSINKIEVSDLIYSFYEALKQKDTFFRCVKNGSYSIAALYWKTNFPELSSGRKGLYIVIGFLLNDCDENFDVFWSYSMNFFRILENQFGISMQDRDSDQLFEIIQQGETEKLKKLEIECQKLEQSFKNISFKKIFCRKEGILQRNFKKISYLYILNNTPDFYANWTAFMYEAFSLISKCGNGDITNLDDYTMFSIHILQNGDKMPELDICKARVKKYRNYKYLIVS